MSTRDSAPVYFDPYNVEIWSDPYAIYRRLREEAPVYYNDQHDFYACSRFEDVERGLMDKETFINGRGNVLEVIKANVQAPAGIFIMEDPPIHTAHRGALSRIFTPKNMSMLEPKIRDFCARSLDPLIDSGQLDFVADLGAKMPIRVIGMLLGIPDEDLESVRQSADAKIRTERGQPMVFAQETASGEDFADYINWREKHPSDDVMTQLLHAEFKDETGTMRKLTRGELLAMINMLATAGNETTNRLIGWTGKVLAEHPEQRREIAKNPGMIPAVIEEVLRFESPGPHAARYVTRDVEVQGVKIPKGSSVDFLIGAANRDHRRFVDGDHFDVKRQARPHLAFGYGIHACMGAALARIEGRIALEEVLKRFTDWEVDYDNAELSSATAVRGWETMPTFTGPGGRAARDARKAEKAASTRVEPTASVEGTWNVVVKSPAGPMPTTLLLERVNGELTGSQSGQGMTTPITDVKIDGNNIVWKNEVKQPMKMKLQFSGVINGSEMSGKVKAGFMGSFPFTGAKA